MQEFLLVFRREHKPEMKSTMKQWQDWMGSLGAQNKLVNTGNPLEEEGKVVKTSVVMNGPYVETKETVGGYTIIRANSLEEAAELAKGCPVLYDDGNVEVRPIRPIM